jgi:hypothetical protein
MRENYFLASSTSVKQMSLARRSAPTDTFVLIFLADTAGGNSLILRSDLNIVFLHNSPLIICAGSSKRLPGSTVFFSLNHSLHNLAFTNLSLDC